MNLDTIRSKARRTAWSTDPEGGVNYNPFARVRSRRESDIENPHLRRYQSEQPLSDEQQRRAEASQAAAEFGGPTHAGTAPPTSATTETGPVPDFDNVATQDFEQSPTATTAGTSKTSKETSDTLVNGSENGSEKQEGARKRNVFKGIMRKPNHEDDIPEDQELPVKPEDRESDREMRRKMALKRKIPIGSQIRAVLFGSWINILLLFVPVGFVLGYLHIPNSGVATFIVNFIAIIPLAAVLSYSTEELALRVGETLGGLLNASFGNAVELIVSIQALVKGEITIVKTSLIGSMLSNLLLVMGMAFFLGGITRLEQYFNVTVAQTAASLLALCIGSLIIPTVFHSMLSAQENNTGQRNQELSHGTAVILLLVYASYLVFQLKSHAEMYNAPSQKVPKRKRSKLDDGDALRGIAQIGAGTAAASGGIVNASQLVRSTEDEEEDEIEEPQLSVIGALISLAISTTLVAFCSEFMVDSIESITEGGKVSKVFVGLILLPIVGNAAEHATAVTVAMKDKMDLAIGVAVGSSMQIALLVLPFTVVLGWILDEACMTLYFDEFQIAVLFVAVLLVNYLIQDGKSHWLEGVLLIASYFIIAISAWFYPESSSDPRCTK
ncbi:calcium/proton exchanger [Delitschia confertaspora ATCC 74209]|uniref:Calcium/proton exchanger n=1 Tax=Delitschia confertaspora ATCC 74209 TaxID=1513339 RepID=A0A9P4JH55_9PLEO|nr:calcium/proton exchanger [Delitschia confertaspora ATCC 74209]